MRSALILLLASGLLVAAEPADLALLGHDLLEDTDITAEELLKMGFTVRIVEGIKAMTKVPGETYEEYKAKVKANRDAVKAKMKAPSASRRDTGRGRAGRSVTTAALTRISASKATVCPLARSMIGW